MLRHVSEIRLKMIGQSKNVSFVEIVIRTKHTRIEKPGNQNVLTARGHMLHLTKGVQNTEAGIQTTCG